MQMNRVHEENRVWELVDISNNIKPMGCEQIFKIKIYFKRNIELFEARIVAKGSTQREGVDFI